MALVDRSTATMPRWPEPMATDPSQILLGYNPYADELTVAFGGVNRPAMISPVDGPAERYLDLRLDLATEEEVVGIQLDLALAVAAVEHPSWRVVVEAAPSEPVMRRADGSVWPALASFVAEVKKLAGY